MATVRTAIDSTEYTKVVDTAVTDALIQNTGTCKMLVVFSAGGVPVADFAHFDVLESGDAVAKISSNPPGHVYVRTYMDNRTGFVSVS